MATSFTTGYTWTGGETITAAKLNSMVNGASVGTIADTDLAQLTTANKVANSALVQITTASKVHGSSLTGFASIPSAALQIPVANLGTGTPSAATYLAGDGAWKTYAGKMIQVVNYQSGTVIGPFSTPFPADNTAPQIDEGTELMSLAITPTSATNKLLIRVMVQYSANYSTAAIALFQVGTSSCLASRHRGQGSNGFSDSFALEYYMTSGSTSEITFTVRGGDVQGSGGTFTFNSGYFNKTALSSITITEIEA